MPNYSERLLSALEKAEAKANGDFDDFHERIMKVVDVIEREVGDDLDDELAEAIEAIRHPDAEDIHHVVETASECLSPRSIGRR